MAFDAGDNLRRISLDKELNSEMENISRQELERRIKAGESGFYNNNTGEFISVKQVSKIDATIICEEMNFCLGNAVKKIWESHLKADSVEELRQAVYYIQREIAKRIK